jgi:hypothetical protein
MAFDLTKIPVFGKRIHSPSFETTLQETFRKVVPELVTVHKAIGIGSLCDWITIFDPSIVRKIYPAEFLLNFIPDPSSTLIVASSSDARTIAVSVVDEHFRYHLVYWKEDEVVHFDTFEDCLHSLFTVAGAQELYDHLFLIGPTMTGVALNLAWERDEVLELIHTYMDSLDTKWQSFSSSQDETEYFYDSTRQFMIQMREDDSSCNVSLQFEGELAPEIQKLVQQWADHAKASNLPAPQLG